MIESWGLELEWGDVDRHLHIPQHIGEWEGYLGDHGYYLGKEIDISNRDGTWSDPLGIDNTYGGEINTYPTKTKEEQLEKFIELKEFFGNPYAPPLGAIHVHVYAPNINVSKFVSYSVKYEKELIECTVKDIPLLTQLRDDSEISKATYRALLIATGALINSWNGRDCLLIDTMEPCEGKKRGAINFYNVCMGKKTYEFRSFRSTTDVKEMSDILTMVEQVVSESQKDNPLTPKQIVEKYSLKFPIIDTTRPIPDTTKRWSYSRSPVPMQTKWFEINDTN